MKFHENILNGFQVIERTRLRDRQTDIRGKNNVYTPVRGRHNPSINVGARVMMMFFFVVVVFFK